MPDQPSPTDFTAAKRNLISGAAALKIDLSPRQVDSFLSYLSVLIQWSAKFSLTSVTEPVLIIQRHFLDSLAILRFLSPKGRLMDIGSGAGFPGLPLKIILPQKEIILVESNRKKANFLRELKRKLDIDGVRIVENRVEELKPNEIGLFDEVVTRAFGSPDLFLRLAHSFLSHDGRGMIMHGPKGAALFRQLKVKAQDLGYRDARIEEFQLPPGKEERRLLIFVKD